jgi:hypothetical protein
MDAGATSSMMAPFSLSVGPGFPLSLEPDVLLCMQSQGTVGEVASRPCDHRLERFVTKLAHAYM